MITTDDLAAERGHDAERARLIDAVVRPLAGLVVVGGGHAVVCSA